MQTSRFFKSTLVAVGLAGGCAAPSAEAATIWLESVNSPVQAGDQAIFELWMDFTNDPTIGGGVDVVFDNFINGNQLTYLSYAPQALGDPDLINTPSVAAANDRLEGITFGDDLDLGVGLAGQALVGTLSFKANIPGTYNLLLAESADAGGFFSISSAQQHPDLMGSGVTVEAVQSAVPLPGTSWLMLIALGGMARARNRLPVRA